MPEAALNHPTPDFQQSVQPAKPKRLPPFSLRLTPEEKSFLQAKAGKMPLGAYIKAMAFADGGPVKRRVVGLEVVDKQALSQTLALLGQSRFSSNLNQVAKAANIGALPVSPELEAELAETCVHVQEIKALLIKALGMQEQS
ncbi:MAG: hypothetical protein AAFW83_02960 [Pseudomonadota bacterium]